MQEVTVTLTVEEVNAILFHLGELPTRSGVFPLIQKVKQQAETQLAVDRPKE